MTLTCITEVRGFYDVLVVPTCITEVWGFLTRFLVVPTCITVVGGFYDVFGSSYLHHRGLGVSDEVFESSS